MLEGDTPTLCLKGNSWGIQIPLACSSPYCSMLPCTDKDRFLSLPTFLQATLHSSIPAMIHMKLHYISLLPSKFLSSEQ